jgi:hypothetical protein
VARVSGNPLICGIARPGARGQHEPTGSDAGDRDPDDVAGKRVVAGRFGLRRAVPARRLLALTAAIWHNRATGRPVTRSLIAYDH